MLEEDLGSRAIDFFGEGLSEQLFDTPAAVARVWRSKAGRRSILVTAAETVDPNGRALAFDWRLLQGDPAKVAIEPLGDGATARITLDWHDPFPVSEDDPIADRPHRRRRVRRQRRARQRPGDPQLVLPADRDPQLRRRPRTAGRRGSSRSTTPTRAAPRPTPTRCWCRAPTGATTSDRRRRGASPAGPAPAPAATPRRSPPPARASSTATPPAPPPASRPSRYLLGRDAAGRLVVEELSTGAISTIRPPPATERA